MSKVASRTVTPPTARVPPTAAKTGINKGSNENNSHNSQVLNAQVEDLSSQVIDCALVRT